MTFYKKIKQKKQRVLLIILLKFCLRFLLNFYVTNDILLFWIDELKVFKAHQSSLRDFQ